MKTTRRRLWFLAIIGVMVLALFDLGWNGDGSAYARGGRGGGGRGGGRGGWGGGSPPPSVGGNRGGGRNNREDRNNERKEAEELRRREERTARVEVARMEYAKRERQQLWDEEAQQRMQAALRRALDGATE